MKKNRKKRVTAGELMARLQQDEAFVARAKERDRQIEIRQTAARKESAALIADLREVGYKVEDVWDLVNTAEPYTDAIPILIDHLSRPYSNRTKEGIARALTVPDAKAAWPILMQEFLNDDDMTTLGAKWAMANAMSVLLDDELVVQTFEIVLDSKHGENRGIIVESFGKLNCPEIREVLMQLLNDDLVGKDARKALTEFDKRRKKRR